MNYQERTMPKSTDFCFHAGIKHGDPDHQVYAIHSGAWYFCHPRPVSTSTTLSIDPLSCSSAPLTHANARHVVWFQLDIPYDKMMAQGLLSANPDYHLVTLDTVLKQEYVE